MDITERKQTEEKIQQRFNELATVNAVSQVAASQLELSAMIELTGEKLRQISHAESIYIALHDPQSQRISFPYWRSCDEIVQAPPITLGQGLTSWVIINRKPLVILEDFEQRGAELGVIHRQFSGQPDRRPKSWMGIPMQVGDQMIGVISIQNFEKEFAFSEDDVRLWETIAANIGIAIQNAQLYTAAHQELAQRKQLIAELEAKNAELERFTYTVSHDLKSPIITIGGFLGYLERDALSGDTERLKTDIARIQNATENMKTLLDDLLELSRIGRMMNPPENVPFSDIVRQSLELVGGQLDARHVRVTFAEDLPVVHGDHARLIEVMQNLIDNAAKFMGDQPEPHIEIGQNGEEDGKPVFYVRDNGIGISPEFHEKIFGLFNKLDPHMEGTGVGLALVKRIIEFHGGQVWIESEVGKGSTFYFTLPGPAES
jgi:signal transduction histidine kinase